MPTNQKLDPALSAAGRREAAAKQQRLGAALRENLLKRKSQQRGRAAVEAESFPPDDAGNPGTDRSRGP